MLETPRANIEFLTGDAWAPRYTQAINAAESSIFLSIYMISHHWKSDSAYQLDLVETLQQAALRGIRCRGIVDQPNVQGRREPFNKKAAEALQTAGWVMRKIPDKTTLHEKVTIIDGRLVFVGSHNISLASACSNIDTSLRVESFALAEVATRHFWETWRKAQAFNT